MLTSDLHTHTLTHTHAPLCVYADMCIHADMYTNIMTWAVILVLGILKQEDCEFEASLSYITSRPLNNK